MGQGRGLHTYVRDELGTLASDVIARVRPNGSDRESVQDCWQTAYVAGMLAKDAAHRSQKRTSSKYLMLAMQSAVYRLLHRRKDLREADVVQICA